MFVLFNILVSYGIIILAGVANIPQIGFLSGLYRLATFIPSLAVAVRRMHDVGKSGWFLLIPIYGFILLCTNGDVGENKYGPDPKDGTFVDGEVLDSDLVKS